MGIATPVAGAEHCRRFDLVAEESWRPVEYRPPLSKEENKMNFLTVLVLALAVFVGLAIALGCSGEIPEPDFQAARESFNEAAERVTSDSDARDGMADRESLSRYASDNPTPTPIPDCVSGQFVKIGLLDKLAQAAVDDPIQVVRDLRLKCLAITLVEYEHIPGTWREYQAAVPVNNGEPVEVRLAFHDNLVLAGPEKGSPIVARCDLQAVGFRLLVFDGCILESQTHHLPELRQYR